MIVHFVGLLNVLLAIPSALDPPLRLFALRAGREASPTQPQAAYYDQVQPRAFAGRLFPNETTAPYWGRSQLQEIVP